MSFVSKFRANWREANPLWWAFVGWTLTVGTYSFGEFFIRTFGWGHYAYSLGLTVLVSAAAIAPFIALLSMALTYKRNSRSLGRIISMFLALVFVCANLNFLLMLHFARGGESPFHGIQTVWGEEVAGRPVPFVFENAFRSIVDCLHFSVITLSTVGYGDIYPTAWYSKIIVDLEILMGLGINILTIGRHFSRRPDEAT